jgi:hypothetical protein
MIIYFFVVFVVFVHFHNIRVYLHYVNTFRQLGVIQVSVSVGTVDTEYTANIFHIVDVFQLYLHHQVYLQSFVTYTAGRVIVDKPFVGCIAEKCSLVSLS